MKFEPGVGHHFLGQLNASRKSWPVRPESRLREEKQGILIEQFYQQNILWAEEAVTRYKNI